MKTDLFLLNYNGADFILTTIDSMLTAVAHSKNECRLTVIDNVSTDNGVSLISQKFPSVPIMQMKENRVLCSFNEAARRSSAEVVFLLNSDLKADPFFIDPLIDVFRTEKDVFLAAPKSYLFDGTYEGGRSMAFVSYGKFGTKCHFEGHEQLMDRPGFTFASGFGAFDRRKFLALGGFDDLYLPGRLEDADIALRAWRLGWKCYYEPKSILYHGGAKSFNVRFGKRGTMEIAHKNTFLFTWKNIHDPRYWAAHWLFLIPWLAWSLLRGQTEFVTGFLKALSKWNQAISKRRVEKKRSYELSDRQVISYFQYGH